jgi:autotransporter strand-loop-strand O-heptosyltransferase
MPYSFTYFKEEVVGWIKENIPTSKRILDVGPGVGTYSYLLRPLGYRMDAVEIFEPYIDKYNLREKYDNVYVGDITTFDISDYDFIILGDVLEHIPVDGAVDLIRRIVCTQECLVAIPYEMEQGEHEGNVHETHHQADLTHAIMRERYPELTELYSNQYYGYYTYTRAKVDKMYVLYANASYHSTVCAAVDSIKKVSDIPITVYMLDCHNEVPGTNTVYWQSDIEDLPKGIHIDRNDSRIYDLLIQRPLIVRHALDNFAKTVCYIDSDSVATPYIDSIFDMYPTDCWYPYFTEGIYDYLHNNGRGGAESRDDLTTTLEHPACELFHVYQQRRDKYRQTGYFIAGQHTIDFLNEWNWMCNHPEILKNPQYYAPYHEETIVNVLLWKYNIQVGLPYIYTNAGVDKLHYIYNEDNWGKHMSRWFRLPDSKEQLLFLHGEKDPVQMSKLMSKIPSKMSKLKILYIAPHLSTGGMPAFLLKTIQTLQHDVDIYVVEYQCHSLDYVVQRDAIKAIVGNNFKTLYEDKMELFNVINDWGPDVIHIHEPSERLDRQMITELYNNNRSYRIIETCHDISFNPDVEKIFHPDYYAFCTPYHVETFNKMPSMYSIIEFPIDNHRLSEEDVYETKIALGFNLKMKHVVNVGLWTPGKNQEEMIELARQMPDVAFHFVGNQAGNFEDYWKPLMKDLPSNVKIWGERDDANKFIDAADVFMFNSVWECNPLVLREAISKGKKIIARDLPQYKKMFSRYITNLDSRKLKNQLEDLLIDKTTYDILETNTTEHFRNKLMSLYKVVQDFDIMENKDYKITQHFIGQPFVEITGTSKDDFYIEFQDANTYEVLYRDTIKVNHWVRLNLEYYKDIRVTVHKLPFGETAQHGTGGRWANQYVVYDQTLDYTGKRVYIAFDSSSLGDTIAWIPYVEEFRKKHNCHVVVSTFKNFLFESVYPELEFVNPGTNVQNIDGMYKLGWFYDSNKEPELPNTIPLQATATNILGLEYKEIKPLIDYIHKKTSSSSRYITIATNSTAGCKFWTKEAWQEIINYLVLQEYDVVNISLEENPFDNCIVLADKSLESTMECISNSEFFIGLSSGLSWLAWALDKEVVMISNFTELGHEFTCHRVTNTNVCHGCWNNPNFKFDKGDWNWCPVHKGTNRQFECQTSITAYMIIEELKKLI